MRRFLPDDGVRAFADGCLAMSVLFGVAFAVAARMASAHWKNANRRWMLLAEFLALHFYLVGLLFATVSVTDLLTTRLV
jgi:ABC-type nickel/cobalt efflux system permease component RcnA